MIAEITLNSPWAPAGIIVTIVVILLAITFIRAIIVLPAKLDKLIDEQKKTNELLTRIDSNR